MLKKLLSIVLSIVMVLSVVYVGSPLVYADGTENTEGSKTVNEVKGSEQSTQTQIPAHVDVYTTGGASSMIAYALQVQIEYWSEKYQGTVFNIVYGNTGTIDQFAALGKTDGSAVLFTDPLFILDKNKNTISSDLSDRSTFRAVSSGIYMVQPLPFILGCREDETRFSSMETLVQYIESHPGEIKIGYTRGSKYEIFIKCLMNVLGIDNTEVQIAADSVSALPACLTEGTYDVICLNNTMAEALFRTGEDTLSGIKGLLHDTLTREGYPYNIPALQNIPILSEISLFDQSDCSKLLIDAPLTFYVNAGTPDSICSFYNTATDGMMDDPDFASRISALGSDNTYQYYSLEAIDAVQQKLAQQVREVLAYDSPAEEPEAAYLSYGTDQYTRNDDDVVYDFVLGDYKQLVNEAINKTDLDERYAAYAKAEAELLDSAVIIPTSTNSGKVTTFFGMLNLNRGTFALGNGNAASNKTESEKISTAVALSNKNFRKALQFAFDKASYNAVNYGEEHKYDNLRNIFTYPELVSLSKQIEADGHVFYAGTTYGQMVQYYLTALGSHINAEDGQNGWYDPAAAVQALNAAKSELGSAVSYPIVIDLVYNNQSSNETDQAQAYKQSIEQTLGSENVRVDIIPVSLDDFYECAFYAEYGDRVNTDLNLSAAWAADNNDPYDFLSCFMKDGAFIINLGLSTAPASATGIYGVRPLDGNNEFFIELGDSVTLSVDSSSMYSNPRLVKWYRLDAESDTLIADCGLMTTGLQTLEVQPDTFTTYYCEVEDSIGTTRAIYFYVSINNGLTIAPKDNEHVKYFETGKDVLLEVEASADRGSLSYVWYEIGDEDPILLGVTEEPYYLFKNVSAEKTVSCTASDDYGNGETANMGLIPVDVEISASENVLDVGTESEDNNVAGSAVPGEVLSAAVENGQPVTVNIVVSSEDASDIPAAEITAIEDKIAEAFPGDSSESISYVTIDLNYTVGEEDPAPITETSEALQITIAVPNAEEGKQYIVVRMHNGRAEVVPSVYEYDPATHTGTITITSDKFSTYAIRQVESFYTVEFDTLGGTSMPSRILGTGSYIAPLPVPEKTGYVFNGWDCAGEAFSIDTTVSSALDPDGDGRIVLTAKWIPAQYEVTFNSCGGSAVDDQLVEYLGKAERPQDPVYEGFIFAGWTDAEGNPFSFNTLIKGNITLYAQWDVDPASAVETYPIWFNLYPDGIYAAEDPETGETVFYDQETGEKVETCIQVTSNNLNDVLGDGGSIKYDPDNSILQFSDPDFGTSSYYGYNGEYSALVVGDTYVALTGSARIPTVYSEYSDSTMAFNGNFRISSQYGALYTAGIVVVQGGSLYAGCNSIPIEADWLVIYGGEVTADAPMAIAVRAHDRIRVEGGSLIASSAANEPAIYTDGYIAVSAGLDDTSGSINASVFTFPGEDPSSYENYEGLEYRMIAIDGITLSGVGIAEPAQGKVSEIQYHTYDIFGDLQTCDAYAVTKADGSASAVVKVEVIPESFTVEFDSNGGSDVPAQTVIKGDCAVRPEDPVRGGYIFRGWKLNDGYYDFSSPVTGDICLVADWKEITVTLKAANLTLEGKISINFKLMSEYEGVTVRLYYEKNDYAQVAEVPLDINNFVVDGSDYYFLVSYNNIPAKEMTLKLRIKAFDSTGTQIPMKISSGYINEYDYSVASWCNRKIEQNSNANDVMIAKALLNYGHYSQLALKYNDGVNGRPNKLANPNGYLAAEMANFAGGNSAYDSVTAGGPALGAKAFALVLESDTSIKLKLKRQVSVLIDGAPAALTPETDGDGTQIWSVFKTDIAAKKLHEKSSFKLTEGSNSATIYYGALSWANKKLTGSDVNDKNLAKAMYLYNYAARKYFHYDEAGLQ